jgi:hypothetical protein
MSFREPAANGIFELGRNCPVSNDITQDALDHLIAAARTRPLNEKLLRASPAVTLRRGMQLLLENIDAVSLRNLLARQGTLDRIRGADIEARYKFNAAVEAVLQTISTLESPHSACLRHIDLMRAEQDALAADQGRFDDAIRLGQHLLQKDQRADAFMRGRLQTLVANLMTIRASNETTIQQLEVTIKMLTTNCDRFREIENVVIPLWKRHALAIANSPLRLTPKLPEVASFRDLNITLRTSVEAEVSSHG